METETTTIDTKCPQCDAGMRTEPDRLKREIRLGVVFIVCGYYAIYWLSGIPSFLSFMLTMPHSGIADWLRTSSYMSSYVILAILAIFLIRFALIFARRFNPRVRICETCGYEEDAGGGISVGETLRMTFWLARPRKKHGATG